MKASAIVVAAGSGKRLGLATPKAFIEIGGSSLLLRVLRVFNGVEGVNEIVLAVPAGAQKLARGEAQLAGLQIPIKITEGGAERQDSVRIALALTSAESDLIIIHDAARPFATPEMFRACLAAAAENGAALVATPVADTLKRANDGIVTTTILREGLWQAQTPQAFRREVLIQAHGHAVQKETVATDDAQLCEELGIPVKLVLGSPFNLKITTPDDLAIGEAIALREKTTG